MTYTLGTAAKATGKSKATISRAIKIGRISASKNRLGQYDIDPAELHSVYPLKQDNSYDKNDHEPYQTPNSDSMLQVEVNMLRERIADKEAFIDSLENQLSEERKRTEAEATERHKLMLMLTDNRSWWEKLIGRKHSD